MKRRRRSETATFSTLSFIDVLASAVGASTLLMVILSALATFSRDPFLDPPDPNGIRLTAWVAAADPVAARLAVHADGAGPAVPRGVRTAMGNIEGLWDLDAATRSLVIDVGRAPPASELAQVLQDPLFAPLRDDFIAPLLADPGPEAGSRAVARIREELAERAVQPVRRRRLVRLMRTLKDAEARPGTRTIHYEILGRDPSGAIFGPVSGRAEVDPAKGEVLRLELGGDGWHPRVEAGR